jgi:hypothetical protein
MHQIGELFAKYTAIFLVKNALNGNRVRELIFSRTTSGKLKKHEIT